MSPILDLSRINRLGVLSAASPDGLGNPAIFLSAHADDETLTLGPAIEQHVNAGRYVICVLVTDGRSSGVKAQLGMDSMAFSKARDREFEAACKALGVNQCFVEGAFDGGLTPPQAKAIALKWTDRFPGGSFKVQSLFDSHVDHRTIGQAFQDRWNETGRVLDLRHYVKREDWDRVAGRVSYPMRVTTGGSRTLAAAQEYLRVDPANGRFGIGKLSVPGSFNALLADPSTRYHLPEEAVGTY